MTSATWNDTMLVGYAPMDAVHQEFIQHIDAVLRASAGDVAIAMRALQTQTRQHFDEEERWMNEASFPARGCHADEHAAVLRSVDDVCECVANGDMGAVRPLAEALLEWFPGHADYMDSALAHWMCKLRYGGAPLVIRRTLAEHAL
jgi:hemerythrin